MSDILLAMLLGWLIADLLTGLFHWLEDRVLWMDMPLLGKLVVEPNREHHLDPMAFVEAGFFARNWTTWAAALPIALGWLWLGGFSPVWLGAVLGGIFANEVHALTHRGKAVPAFWRALQETGLVASAAHHGQHHAGDHDRRYCILSAWLNPWLDLIGFWAALERLLTMIGLEPNRGTK
ncbi:MAG: fatty acid desaturase CarF family protein [Blastomonas sp.]